MKTKQLLDHGELSYVQHMGSDQIIAASARVLVDPPWREHDDPKLIRFMARNGHTSPFEHAAVTFFIRAPIFVFRQWHRHRTQSYNEVSARYKELPEVFYVPAPEHVGVQSETNHQSRTMDNKSREDVPEHIRRTNEASFRSYRALLNAGAPREIARSVLPVGTYSEMYATANVLNWIRFLGERTDESAQYEIRVYADAIQEMLRELYPVTMDAWTTGPLA